MKIFFLGSLAVATCVFTAPDAQAATECPVLDHGAVGVSYIQIPVGRSFSLGNDPEPAYISGNVPGSQVNVRTGPGTEYAATAYGLVGDFVQAFDYAFSSECETWLRVRFPVSGHIGWIHVNHVTFHYGRGIWD